MRGILEWLKPENEKESPDPLKPLEDFFEESKRELEALRGNPRVKKKVVVVSYNITYILIAFVVCIFLTGILTAYHFFPDHIISSNMNTVVADKDSSTPKMEVEPLLVKSSPPQTGVAEPERDHSPKLDLPVVASVTKPPVVKKRTALPEKVLVLPSPDTIQKVNQDTANQEYQPPVISVVDPPKPEEPKEAQVKKGLLPKWFHILKKKSDK